MAKTAHKPVVAKSPAGYGYLPLESLVSLPRSDRRIWARAIALKRKDMNLGDLEDAITTIKLSDTIHGSSTMNIGIRDEDWGLIDSGFLDSNSNGALDVIDCEYPAGSDLWWRLSQVQISALSSSGGCDLTLAFMERAACHLMTKKGAVKTSRASKTRAQFIQGLVKSVKIAPIDFVCQGLTTTDTLKAPTGGRILYVGDSLGVGTVPELRKIADYGIDAFVQESKPSAWGEDQVNAQLSDKHYALVFDMGTNDGDTPSTFIPRLQRIRTKLGPTRPMIVATLNGTAKGMNDEIKAWETGLAHTALVDWENQAPKPPDGDGIHGNYKERASAFHSAIPAKTTTSLLMAPDGPQIDLRRPDASQSGSTQPGGSSAPSKNQGIHKNADIKIKGKAASPEQIRQIERVLGVAKDLKASGRANLALVCACIGESEFRPIMNGQGSAYGGVLQGNVRGGVWDINDSEGMTRSFLKGGKGFHGDNGHGLADVGAIGTCNAHPDWTPGHTAYVIQGDLSNFHGDTSKAAHFYDQWRGEAVVILAAYGDGSLGTGTGSDTSTTSGGGGGGFEQVNYEVGGTAHPHETYWDAIQRLAEEVRWALIVDGQTIYFDSEPTLIKNKPAAVIRRDDASLISFTCDWDTRHISTAATVEVICDPFSFRAGEVLVLDGFGPASTGSTAKLPGRWLIEEIERDMFGASSRLQLKQPQDPLRADRGQRLRPSDTGDVGELGDLSGMTPKEVIDKYVVPLAAANNMSTGKTAAMVEQANAVHGPTSSGGKSDHQGPPSFSWAADMSNGTAPTKEMDKLADDIAVLFGFPKHHTSQERYVFGRDDKTVQGFRCQLGYRTGGHYNHVHFGMRDDRGSGGSKRSGKNIPVQS